VNRKVVLAPEARSDLLDLHDYIAARSGGRIAFEYTERIRSYCAGFADFGERGTRRDDIFEGLRTVGFERRVTIAFHLIEETVFIDRVLYGGRDLRGAFPERD